MLKHTLRRHLEQAFSEDELKRWFDPLGLAVTDAEKRLEVLFPHAFFATWFAQTVQDRFEESLSRYLGPGYVIGYLADGHLTAPGQRPALTPKSIDFPFGHQFSFDSFLANDKNYFPLASAREVAKAGQVTYNPFVVCGPSGSGKTHLLKAIANELSRRHGREAVSFGTVEDLNALFTAQPPDQVYRARENLLRFEALILDDLGLIKRYPDIQQELILVFDSFYDRKKQLIFASQDKLAGYDFLDPTLKSRLEWGLIVNLKQPDLDIRLRFIEQSCKQKKLGLDKEQMLSLAQRFQDFRYLQGILLKLSAFRELVNKDVSSEDFEHILAHTESGNHSALTPEVIIGVVAGEFKLDPKNLKSAKRHHKVVQARQVAMYLCRQLLGISYPALGRVFGGKDHSTVLYGVNKIQELQNVNRDTKNLIQTLKDKCLSLSRE